VLTAEELHTLDVEVNSSLFAQSIDAGEADGVRKSWNKLSASLKKEPELLRGYLTFLIEAKAHDEAGKFILKSLKQEWNSSLVRLYGLVETGNKSRQLARAESWLTDHARDAQLQLCLGRLSARNELWGKARDYFENSYRLERSAEVCAELGRLLAGLGEAKVSAAYFREGLLLKETALPDLPMPDIAVSRARGLANA
jgi:HemY protein